VVGGKNGRQEGQTKGRRRKTRQLGGQSWGGKSEWIEPTARKKEREGGEGRFIRARYGRSSEEKIEKKKRGRGKSKDLDAYLLIVTEIEEKEKLSGGSGEGPKIREKKINLVKPAAFL